VPPREQHVDPPEPEEAAVAEDIYPVDAVTRVIDFYAGSNMLIGGKRRIAGVTLEATDANWSHGSGPVVQGPAMALLMVTAGRRAAVDDLSGPGLDILRGRMT
jgi:hypothetical protein